VDIFSNNLGKQHVFVLYGLGGAGRAKLRSNLLTHARLKPRILGMPRKFPLCTGLMPLSSFSDIFYIDASTKETISAHLGQIALAKGIGKSEKATLDWLSGQRKEWLLLLDNADDPTLIFVHTFPLLSW